MDLMKSVSVSASGMAAQSTRMQMIAENIANANSIETPEGGPYRRKVILFKAALDQSSGLHEVKVQRISKDYSKPLKQVYDPTHELADANGFVAHPNVSTFLENIDMREASRAYEANMSAIESAKEMMVRSLDLLR